MLTCTDIQEKLMTSLETKLGLFQGVGAGIKQKRAILRAGDEREKEHLTFQKGWADPGAAGARVAAGAFLLCCGCNYSI